MGEKNKNTFDWWLLLISLSLTVLGLLMVYSSSFVLATNEYRDNMFYLKKQLVYAIGGIVSMLVLSRINYRKLRPFSFPILLFSIFLLILPLVPGIGVACGGARRWISIFGFQFQPSEFAKLAVILYFASTLSLRIGHIKKFHDGVLPYLFIIGIVVFIILKQKSLSMAIIISGVFLFLLYIAGIKHKHLLPLFLIFIIGASIFAIVEPYRVKRIIVFTDKEKDAKRTNYQIQQSFIALGVGGISGIGMGQSRQKFLFLPQPHTDFIFSIIGEEIGIIGTSFVLLLFILFGIRGLRISLLSPDYFGFLLAGGITFQIILQVMINTGVAVGCLPVTGVPLPFISYGGSSLIITLTSVGILLSVSRYSTSNI